MDYEEIIERQNETRHGRTRFQLERFVVGQHPHPVMQYHQLVTEAAALVRELRNNELEAERLVIEADELDATGTRSKQISAIQNRVKAEELEAVNTVTRREIDAITEMIEQYPRYTLDDIERTQSEYWRERLLGQANLQMMAGGAVGFGHLEAIVQAGLLGELMSMNPQDEIAKLATLELEGDSDD